MKGFWKRKPVGGGLILKLKSQMGNWKDLKINYGGRRPPSRPLLLWKRKMREHYFEARPQQWLHRLPPFPCFVRGSCPHLLLFLCPVEVWGREVPFFSSVNWLGFKGREPPSRRCHPVPAKKLEGGWPKTAKGRRKQRRMGDGRTQRRTRRWACRPLDATFCGDI